MTTSCPPSRRFEMNIFQVQQTPDSLVDICDNRESMAIEPTNIVSPNKAAQLLGARRQVKEIRATTGPVLVKRMNVSIDESAGSPTAAMLLLEQQIHMLGPPKLNLVEIVFI